MTEIEAVTSTTTSTLGGGGGGDTTTTPSALSPTVIDSGNMTTTTTTTTTTIGDGGGSGDIINANTSGTAGGQQSQSQSRSQQGSQQRRTNRSNKHKLTVLNEKGEFSPSSTGYRMAVESKQYGNVCYADPNELFPQATYYLRPDLKRPEYHTNLNNNESNNNTGDELKDGGSKKRKSRSSVAQSDTPLANEDDDNKKDESEVSEEHVSVLVAEDNLNSPNNSLPEKKKKNPITNAANTHELFEAEDSVEETDQENRLEEEDEAKIIQENLPKADSKKFGTWDGVYVSCLLNIFGILMFIRLGFIVGQAGLWYTIIIILLATVVTTLTALSMAAIATNGEQRAGGAYYMISRTLGPAIGGAVGVLYSFGMSVAVSMHIIGMVETIVDNFGLSTDSLLNDVRLYGVILITICFVCAIFGIGWVIKVQLVLLVALVLGIFFCIIGSFTDHSDSGLLGAKGWSNGNLVTNMSPHFRTVNGIEYDFFVCFGLFFPACTGILAGANISGDLKNPSENIPKGTLLAIFSASFVYLLMALAAAAAITYERLIEDYFAIVDLSVWKPLVDLALYVASFSSGLCMLVGAPRILRSVAMDNLLPFLKPFTKTNSKGEPIRACFFSYCVAICCVLVADLNVIAPLITQFFLGTYAFISVACYYMTISHSPAWRPSFKYYSKHTALVGSILCVSIMLATRLDYAVVAIIVGTGIWGYVSYAKPNVNWGSAFESRAKWKANKAVLSLMRYKAHVKNFQPSFLVMCGRPETRIPLLKFVYTLQQGHGAIVYANVIVGEFTDHISELKQGSRYLPENMKMQAFFETVTAPTIRKGAHALFQLAGLGNLRPNVLVLGFKNKWYESLPRTAANREALMQSQAELDDDKKNAKEETTPFENKDDWSNEDNDQNLLEENKPLLVLPENETKKDTSSFSNDDYVALLLDALKYKMGFMICRGLETLPFGDIRSDSVTLNLSDLAENNLFRTTTVIDVWWLLDDGGLSLLVPHLMSIDRFWRQLSSANATTKEKRLTKRESRLAKLARDDTTRNTSYMVRLFLIADDDMGADTTEHNNTKSTDDKHLTDVLQQETKRHKKTASIQEILRIARQGLVSNDLITTVKDPTDLWKAELASLLQKFRLNINGPYTVKSGRREPTMETYNQFSQLTGYDLDNPEHDHVWSDTKLNRWLRVSEMIHAYSRNQRCVFVTAPFPTCFDNSTMYLGVLDMLSRTTENRATVLLRGTGDNVLTFYSE